MSTGRALPFQFPIPAAQVERMKGGHPREAAQTERDRALEDFLSAVHLRVAGITELASAATIELDFALLHWALINPLAHDVTFSTLNLQAGVEVQVTVVCDGTPRNLTFPGGWTFLGAAAPASIAAGKAAVLTLTTYGDTDAEVLATWQVEP